MAKMHRTQIYLEPDLNAALDRLARRRGTSKADLIRRAARQLLDQEETGVADPVLGLIGLGNAGPGATSVEHDRVLAEQSIGPRS